MKKGSFVSRLFYQKLQEENKRLLADIKVMACGECFDAIQMRLKWRRIFKEKQDFDNAIRDCIRILKT
jgi:hypothetical protein